MSSNFIAQLSKRDFSTLISTPGLRLKTKRFSSRAQGGPEKALIEVNGDFPDLWQVATWLRAPVEIRSPLNELCWWGYVADITLYYANLQIEISIDRMWNKIAVRYNELETGRSGIGIRGTTSWSTDTSSIALYGTKEKMISLPDMNQASAEAARDQFLTRWKLPQGLPDPQSRVRQRGAVLRCRGWWDTANWLMFSRDAGIESHEVEDDSQALGALATNEKIKMEFQLSTAEGWNASAASVKMSKESTAAELNDPTVELWTAGLVAKIADGTIDRTLIPELPFFSIVTAQWDLNPALALATTYEFLLDSKGTYVDDEYAIRVDEGLGYGSGSMELYDDNGGSWAARVPNADLWFRITGTEETTVQMEEVYNVFNQFLTGFELALDTDGTEQVSGIFTSQYRDGDIRCMEELLDLMAIGRDSGNRYLATITPARVLRIWEEPDEPTNIDYRMGPEGQLFRKQARVPAGNLPVGFWMRTLYSVPAAIRTSTLAKLDPMFVDWIEYNVDEETFKTKTRDQTNPFDITSLLRDGR